MAQGQNPSEGMSTKGSPQDLTSRFQGMRQQAEQNLHEGAVTSAYKANREEIIGLLNRALASEWSAFLQYWHHYFMASDIHGAEVRDIWKEHAEDEYEHARRLNERINQLGGVPANAPKMIEQLSPTPFEAGHDLRSMIRADLVAEREVIAIYNEIVRICGFDDNETRRVFEDFLQEENEHANELSNLLFQFDASTGKPITSMHQEAIAQQGQQARTTTT